MVGNQNPKSTLRVWEWWATKIRYPPYEYGNGEQQKPVGSPTSTMVGNKNTLPTLQSISNLKEF
ncbi:MAG: hypothetical protein DRR16_23960 [Candidatus Parabeggiatoa sp. nov. 3]|nr:MAG: hypothetical protein DRR00_26995 [Gammaproteobacteria bacterium]RKZ57276.1 MAG: hypothetical protein DRQ99_27185 [Gammaproteobacteria bacterium]RKZ80381.1 MAG: hypothetical protein DRR16_23960 [Gammaproteobacteria bacterium]HEW97659.1 hypothetical protein [Beggiatoa sp.]